MKSIGLVAHDKKKDALADWSQRHADQLKQFRLYATGTTGGRIVDATGLEIKLLKSGPLGGDAQLGSMIVEDDLDALIFFIDPLTAMPHDVDVKALIRLATLYDVPFACNEKTAEAIIAHMA